jgi:selenocysteine lyase/cysteine desulfurase
MQGSSTLKSLTDHGAVVDPEADWEPLRRQMPVAQRWAYFDHAAVAPLTGPARRAVVDWSEEAARSGDVAWPPWRNQIEQLRAHVAEMIHADTAEIALIRNTTEGVNLVAEGYPWQSGDNVVTLADEFPTNQYPWLHLADRGVETRRVATDDGRVDPDRLAAALDRRTRVLSISWVGYASGWRNDLEQAARIAHQHGALLFVDAIQGLGVFPLDVRSTPIDFLAADGHKWMMGPEGAGVFFLRREHLDRLRPVGVGWNSMAAANDFSRIELALKNDASRYEGGSHNMVGLIGLKASLQLLAQFGQDAISRRVLEITDRACERLAAAGAVIRSDRRPQHKSGIVSFELPGHDPQEIRRRCLEQHVVLSCRAGRLRISPHAYNNEADLDRLIAAISEFKF